MRNNGVKDFFYSGNAVHGKPDYGLADNFVRTAPPGRSDYFAHSCEVMEYAGWIVSDSFNTPSCLLTRT